MYTYVCTYVSWYIWPKTLRPTQQRTSLLRWAEWLGNCWLLAVLGLVSYTGSYVYLVPYLGLEAFTRTVTVSITV